MNSLQIMRKLCVHYVRVCVCVCVCVRINTVALQAVQLFYVQSKVEKTRVEMLLTRTERRHIEKLFH